jgi:hypothetical protein
VADDDLDDAYREFSDAVNMTKSELQKWLDSDESRSVGMTAGGDRKTSPELGPRPAQVTGRAVRRRPVVV